ncbi:MAG: tyrosine-type recombinase/integrase [Candidatus Marinimicrobia bacterium]|nr:tyrosine-type recombinase/integrase [Candidatus Neomarinimicrobiota bacterium]
MAGLRKLKGKYYSRIWYKNDQGKRREKLIPLNTKSKRRARELNKEVEKQERAFKQGLMNLDEIEPRHLTDLDHIIDQFFNYLNVSGKSEATISLYRLALDTFSEIYQGVDIELLGKQDYTDFLSKMKDYYPNNTTCNIRLRSIRAFLNWCLETGKIKRIPFKIRQLPVKKTKPRYYSDQEMELILNEAKADKELYARIYTHWKTGLRRGELHNSYFENGFIKTYDPIKNGKERSIPISKETRKQYFIAKDGTYIDDTVSGKFKDILVSLGLYKTKHGDKRNFHCLRNTFAVKKYFQTRDIYRVKVLLGHASVKTTEKYADFDIAELDQDFDISQETQQNSKYVNPNSQRKGQRQRNSGQVNGQDKHQQAILGYS